MPSGQSIAVSSKPSTFTILFVADAATYVVFLLLLTLVPERRMHRESADAAGAPRGYAAAARDRVFLALLGLNIVFVTAGYAQLETLPVFAKNAAAVSERGIGLVFLVNSLIVVIAQLPVTRLVEGRRRMATLMLMTLLWAGAWLLVFGAGLWLTAVAAAACIAAGAAALALERRLPEPVHRTPGGSPPGTTPRRPETAPAGAREGVAARASG